MNWELIISIASLITGGGCILWIFQAGAWKGTVTAKLESLQASVDELSKTIEGKVKSEVGHNTSSFDTKVLDNAAVLRQEATRQAGELRKEMTELADELRKEVTRLETSCHAESKDAQNSLMVIVNRIHARLDERQSAGQLIESKVEALIAGIAQQRREWDALLLDIRTLLTSNAATKSEIDNFKARLSAFENKVSDSLERIARLESDVAHLSADRRK